MTATAAFIRPVGTGSTASTSGAVLVGGGPADRYRRSHRPAPRGRHRSARPNYLARRCGAAIGLVLAVSLAVPAVGALVASLGGAPASAAEVSPAAPTTATHVARSGDTLWSIAAAHRGEVGHDRYLDALIRLNGGTRIEVGQAVLLP